MLHRVDQTPLTRQQKLRLYRVAVCPRLNWDLTVNNVPLSWIKETMEATATRYLKRWSGLARSADPSRLYLPQSKGGLNPELSGRPSLSFTRSSKFPKPASCWCLQTQQCGTPPQWRPGGKRLSNEQPIDQCW